MIGQEPLNLSVLVVDRGAAQCEVEEEGLAVVAEEPPEVVEALETEGGEEEAGEGVEEGAVDSVLAEVVEEAVTRTSQDLEGGAHSETAWELRRCKGKGGLYCNLESDPTKQVMR